MRNTVELRRPGWTKSRWLRRSRPLVLLLALAFAGPVLASDTYTDVPTTNPHHNDINGIASAGITRGCNPPDNTLYCPADFVRRDQMASFLQRGLPRIEAGGWFNQAFVPQGAELPYGPVVISITAGVPAGDSQSTGYLKVDASGRFDSTDSNPCEVSMSGQVTGGPEFPGGGNGVASIAPAGGPESLAFTWSTEVGAGTHEITIHAIASDIVASNTCDAFISGDVNVMYIPFDGNANNDD